jgi:oligopeptidase B
MLDCNELGKKYFKLSGLSISDDNQLATYAIDLVGRRIYTLEVKNLITGEILSDKIKNTTGNSTWAGDNKTIFYTTRCKYLAF